MFHCIPSSVNFSTRSRPKRKYHTATKHSVRSATTVHNCERCSKIFHRFYLLGGHERRKQGTQRGSGAQNIDVTNVVGVADDNNLTEELQICKNFLLDSELKNGRHKVFHFAMGALDPNFFLKKLRAVFRSLEFATRLIVAFGFGLKTVEGGS